MKRLMTVLAAVSPVFGAFAADYFNAGYRHKNAEDKYVYEYVTTAVWAPVEQTVENPQPLETPSADNTYWIVEDYQAGTNSAQKLGQFVNSKDQVMPGRLCVGSPAGHPIFGSQSGTLQKSGGATASMKATINWYNGTLYKAGYYANTYLSTGVINVLDGGANSVHKIYNKVQTSDHSMQHAFACPFVCEDPSINISITCGGTGSEETAVGHVSYVQFNGDNSQYKGSFSLETAYFSLVLGGTEPLGDPNTPNPAALTVCDKGVISCSATAQSASRGIRFEGESAYLLSKGADIKTVRYPISRAENALGNLIKIGDGTNTLACAWTAGDIEVKTGTLILDVDAVFPAGQKFKVDDGATLMFTTVIDDVEVTVEGSGQVIYPEGWRLNADNEWEVKVSLTTEGEGTVAGTHLTDDSWTLLGSAVTLTATPGAGVAFLHWSGDVARIPGGRAMTSPATVKAAAPLALGAHFGVLTKPEDVTAGDGTTFVFADRVLTVTVPATVTCGYDYSSLVTSGYVTNIVKSGAGTLTLCAAEGYYGDWDIVQGCCALATVGGLGANDCGAVNVRSGASLWSTLNAECASGKAFSFAGAGISGSTPGAYGTGLKQTVSAISGRFVLSGATTFYTTSALRIYDSSIDLAGYNLTLAQSADYLNVYVENCTITNSSNTAVTMSLSRGSGNYILGGNDWGGGAKNVVTIGNNSRIKLSGPNTGDWTLKANGSTMHLAATIASTGENHTKCCWDGPFNVNGKDVYLARQDIGAESCVTFGGPVIGSGDIYIYGICNWLSAENTFSGTIRVLLGSETKQQPKKIRPGLWLFEGANFSCGSGKAFSVTKGDVHFAAGTDYEIPILTCNEDCRIFGTEETVAKIGTLNGFPAQVTGFGDLQITGGWTVPMAEVNTGKCLAMDSGSLTFANGSALTVTKESDEKLSEGVVIASAPDGIVGLPKSRYQTELSADGTSLALKSKGIVLIVR